MKKLLAILLAAVMLIGTLAACGTTTPGSDVTPATEGEKEADAGEEAPAASGDKVKISMRFRGRGNRCAGRLFSI